MQSQHVLLHTESGGWEDGAPFMSLAETQRACAHVPGLSAPWCKLNQSARCLSRMPPIRKKEHKFIRSYRVKKWSQKSMNQERWGQAVRSALAPWDAAAPQQQVPLFTSQGIHFQSSKRDSIRHREASAHLNSSSGVESWLYIQQCLQLLRLHEC